MLRTFLFCNAKSENNLHFNKHSLSSLALFCTPDTPNIYLFLKFFSAIYDNGLSSDFEMYKLRHRMNIFDNICMTYTRRYVTNKKRLCLGTMVMIVQGTYHTASCIQLLCRPRVKCYFFYDALLIQNTYYLFWNH